MNLIPVARAVKKCGPAAKWKGRCYEIACMMVNKGIFEGTPVYGHFIGPIHKESMFYRNGMNFAQHGWILQDDGTIIDPTYWTFGEGGAFIAKISKNDKEYAYYDEGGNAIRAAMMKPAPNHKVKAGKNELFVLKTPAKITEHIKCLIGHKSMRKDGKITSAQMFWLANLPYDTLEPFVIDIYKEIERLDLSAFIPCDNRAKAARWSKKKGD